MANIIYIISSLRKSGPVNVLYDICKMLDRSKFRPIIVTLKGEDKTRSIKDNFIDLGIEVYAFQFSNLQMELFPGRVARIIMNEIIINNKSVIHAHCYHASLIASHLKKYRSVETIHCIAEEEYNLTYGDIKGKYLMWRHIRNLKNIDYPVAISDYMFQYYKDICNKNLITIYNGVDFCRKKDVDIENLKDKLGIPRNKKIVLYSGFFSVRKNAKYIISELKSSKRSDFICVFIGKGDLLEECKSLVIDDPRFMFKGYVFNVSDYLSVADIYISASMSEGLPLAVLEALNMGVPSLLSAIPPHNEISTSMDLPSVRTFSLRTDGLKTAFEDMYMNVFDRNAIAQKAFLLFSSETMTRKYEKLYNDIIEE